MDAIAIIGQSNGSQLWQAPVAGLVPAPDTFMIQPGTYALVPPVNALIEFANRITAHTGAPICVLPGAVGGTALLNIPGHSLEYWLDKYGPNSPLLKFLPMLATVSLRLVIFIGGESEGGYGTTAAQFLGGLNELHAIIAGAAGIDIDKLPFMVTPLGMAEQPPASFPYGRYVLTAQYGVARHPPMVVGPEYWDLPRLPDNGHVADSSQPAWADRLAAAAAPLLGVSAAPLPPPPAPPANLAGSSATPPNAYAPQIYSMQDMSWALPNGAVISKLGLYSAAPDNGATASIMQSNGAGQYTTIVSQPFSHPGGGWSDVTITPFTVPASGIYRVSGRLPNAFAGLSLTPRAYLPGQAVGTQTWLEDVGFFCIATRAFKQ